MKEFTFNRLKIKFFLVSVGHGMVMAWPLATGSSLYQYSHKLRINRGNAISATKRLAPRPGTKEDYLAIK